jgi:hypothetical protein
MESIINKSNFSISETDLGIITEAIKKELCFGSITQTGSTIYYKSKFLDFSNDEIVLKIDLMGNQIKISDDNRTILSLLSSGFDPLSTKRKKYLIDSLVGGCGVEIEKYGEVFTTSENISEVGEKVFWMIHAIQRLTEAVIVGKMYKPPSFKRDVSSYLTENKRDFIENPYYNISSKLKARIDFGAELDGNEIICRALSYTNIPEAVTFSEKFVYEIGIIQDNYRKGKRSKAVVPIAVIDDSVMISENEPVFNDEVLHLMDSVKIIPWSEKTSLLEFFPSLE